MVTVRCSAVQHVPGQNREYYTKENSIRSYVLRMAASPANRCGTCDGTGYIYPEGDAVCCPDCDGTGQAHRHLGYRLVLK